MPVYTYICEEGHIFDRYLKLKDYKKPQTCICGKSARRQIMPTMLNCDMQPWDRYISPVSGKPITSYKERREDMAKYDCVDYEPSLTKHVTQKVKDDEKKLDKAVDETVEQLIDAMPARKKEQLETELKAGADCTLERR